MTSGRAKSGSCRSSSEIALVFTPVHEPRPISISVPIPAASRPGIRMSGSRRPASPAASISSTAAISGEPNRNEIAAKVPQAATIACRSGGASARIRRIAKKPRPPPSAIRGASGPTTAPSPIPAIAASMTPGRSIGWVGAALSPFAGMCPPRPGRRAIAKATTTPANASHGNDHHSGVWSKPSASGRSVYTPCCASYTASRNSQEAKDAITPMIAASTSRPTNCLLRMIAAGSGGEAGAWAMRWAAYWAGLSGNAANG